MPFVKRDKNGDYYLYVSNQGKGRFNPRKYYKRKIFLVKCSTNSGSGAVIQFKVNKKKFYVCFPKEFLGKRICFKIEEI